MTCRIMKIRKLVIPILITMTMIAAVFYIIPLSIHQLIIYCHRNRTANRSLHYPELFIDRDVRYSQSNNFLIVISLTLRIMFE